MRWCVGLALTCLAWLVSLLRQYVLLLWAGSGAVGERWEGDHCPIVANFNSIRHGKSCTCALRELMRKT